MRERRRYTRYSLNVATTVWSKERVIRGATLCNISLGGICLKLPAHTKLEQNEMLRCAFTVKIDSTMISVSCEGSIAWRRGDALMYVGIAFSSLDSDNQHRLERIIAGFRSE